MLIYFYTKDTKEYFYQAVAHKDLNASIRLGYDVWVKPPFSTYKEPLEVKENEVTTFNEEKDEWEIKPDFRGKKAYNEKTGDYIIVKEIGNLPKNYSLEKPFILQKAKIEKTKEVVSLYKKELEKKIDLGKIEESVNNKDNIDNILKNLKENYINYETSEGNYILLTKEELQEFSNILYKRNLLLTVRQNEIIKELKLVKNKKQFESIKIDFNISKEMKKTKNLNKQEFESYIKERL